jgi:hypothetical protein
VGFTCESGIFEGGYLQIGRDTKIDLRITRNHRGSCANRPFFFLRTQGRPAMDRAPVHRRRRWHGQRGGRRRTKTGRGEREEPVAVLTRSGDRWKRPDFNGQRRAAARALAGAGARGCCRARRRRRRVAAGAAAAQGSSRGGG